MSEPDRTQEELMRILGLVESGELSADDADELISAMNVAAASSQGAGAAARAAGDESPTRSSDRVRRRSHDAHVAFDERAGRRELSAELRKLQREARRITHEARRTARHDLREALREARHEIRNAVKLGVKESSRAIEEVKAELESVFGESRDRSGRRPRWLAGLAGLDLQRDRVKHTAEASLGADVERGQRIVVRNVSGDVAVKGWDQDRVELTARKTAWGVDQEVAQDRAEALPVEIQRRNGEMLIDARGPVPAGVGLLNLQRMHTDLVVSLPSWAPLEVTTKSGDVSVGNHAAELSVSTTSGDARLSTSGAKVKVETVSGDVGFSGRSAAEVELSTLSGDISAEFRPSPGGQYRLRSSSGDVRARLEAGAAAKCEVETASGDISVNPPWKIVSRGRRRVVAEVEGQDDAESPAQLSVATLSGDARISGA